MGVWRRNPGAALLASPFESTPPSDDRTRQVAVAAAFLASEINVLLGVANDSHDFPTKTARLASAKQKLSELMGIASLHPSIGMTNLVEVQACIVRVESELLEYRLQSDDERPGPPKNFENVNTESSSITVGELQNKPLSAWGNADIINGLRFSATLQLRTPLRILLRHGEIHIDEAKPPPIIIQEGWEGIWLPAAKSFEEALCHPNSTDEEIRFYIRIDAGLADINTVASDIGPIREDDYLPFLVALRRIIEVDDTIENRIKMLRETNFPADWQRLLHRHDGIDGLVERFFPQFMNLASGLNTPNRIAAAPDKTLLAIKGIGPATLRKIRVCCAEVATNRDCDRIDMVRV